MKINGLNVDEQAIADGLYAIICEKGEEAIVAFGMIPKWIMDMLERILREKVISLASIQLQVTPEELVASGFIDEQMVKDTIQPIIKAVASGIYASASKAGMMVV